MRRLKTIICVMILLVVSSTNLLFAQELTIESNRKILTLEDAIERAKNRSKQLRLQQKNVEYAKKDLKSAYYDYQNASEYSYEHANFNYAVKLAEKDYAKKVEPLWEEKIIYDIESQFDAIIDAEEKHDLAKEQLKVQKQKIQNINRKKQLGLESQITIDAEEAALGTQIKEIKHLDQIITAEYRKLNDKIGGSGQKYTLIKENVYEPVDKKRTLDGYISYAISMNPNLWLQEKVAELKVNLIGVNSPDGSGAPTYTEYQKSQLDYEKGIMGVSAIKETAELGLKELYDGILTLEAQYEKALLALKETRRQYTILEKQYQLGLIPGIVLEEAKLGVKQMKTQINSMVRQHNSLKSQFEKSYIMQLT